MARTNSFQTDSSNMNFAIIDQIFYIIVVWAYRLPPKFLLYKMSNLHLFMKNQTVNDILFCSHYSTLKSLLCQSSTNLVTYRGSKLNIENYKLVASSKIYAIRKQVAH